MDPLSDVLSLLKPRSYASAGLEAGGDWSIRFPQYEGIKFNAVLSGRCWLSVEGEPDAVHLKTGDCFLLLDGRPFRLASDLALPSIDASSVFLPETRRGGVARCNEGRDFFLAGSIFTLDGRHAGLLLDALPPVIHLRNETDRASLRWLLERLGEELRDPQPGSGVFAEHLAHLMLIQGIRLHLANAGSRVGWLFALRDGQIGEAIDQMHADPARHWTLRDLARSVGMSRTAFAVRFKTVVGLSAIDYLTRWRMLIAGNRLLNSGDAIVEVAAAVGYQSESAFGAAFKRVMGQSPRQYVRSPTRGLY